MQSQISITSKQDAAMTSAAMSKSLQLFGALLLGTILLSSAGFVKASAVHNAAHDTRHSQGFPCH